MAVKHGLHDVVGECLVGILGKSEKKDVLIVFNPKTPDRTAEIRKRSDAPVRYLDGSAKMLKKLGADYFGVPCNTAHYFIPKVTEKTSLPLVDMIAKTAERVKDAGVKKAGLLATTGTVSTGLYQKALEDAGVGVILPNENDQESCVMEAIYGKEGIKAGITTGQPSELLHGSAYDLMERGADCIITGCTEIPLVITERELEKGRRKAVVIDPSRVLAEELAKRKGVAGIAGGLGPAATVDLLRKMNDTLKDRPFANTITLLDQIVLQTPAKKDQEHLTMVATAIKKGGVEKLELAGVDFMAASRDWEKKDAVSGARILNFGHGLTKDGNFEKDLACIVVKEAKK